MSTGTNVHFFSTAVRGHGLIDIQPRPGIPGLTSASNVLAAVTEIGIFNGVARPFIGSASIQVLNIAPHDGIIETRLNIDWDEDIEVRVGYVIWP
jgi:hypothetical protein